MCVPSAVCATRREAPSTRLDTRNSGQDRYLPVGNIPAGTPLVVLQSIPKGQDILVEVLEPHSGDFRWVMARYLRFDPNQMIATGEVVE